MPAQTEVAIDLNPHYLKEVLRILGLYVSDVDVRAFGSRVKWTAKAYSDLDLALMTKRPLSLEQEARLREAFDESTLPFKVDFVDWASTSKTFQNIISADSVLIRPASRHTSDEKWLVMPLEEALDALLDYSGKTPEKTSFGVPLITAKIVKNGSIEPATEFIAREKYSEWMTRGLPRIGDVVLTTEAPLGEVAQLHTDQVALAQRLVTLRGKAGVLDNTYLRYLLQTDEMQEQLAARATGTTVLGIKQSELRKIMVRLPSLERQRAAAAMLASLDDRITLLRETNATLEAIAQALFKSWFVEFDPVRAKMEGRAPEGMDEATAALFPDALEETEVGLVPKGWRLLPFESAYDINPTRKLKKGKAAPYLDMASVNTQGHIVSGVVQREMGSGTKYVNGDTLLARITPCLENGKTAFVDFLTNDQVGWGSTEFVVLRPKPPLTAYHGYLLCRHQAFREHAIQSMSGTSGQQRVQNDVLGRFPVAVPPQDVAMAFSEPVTAIQQTISGNHAQAQTLAELRDTLLPRLISGQLRLPDAVAELEAAHAV